MNTKILKDNTGLYYREIGELPKLRRVNNTARNNRDKNRLDIACEYLKECLNNPAYIENYELKRGLQYAK